MSRRALALVTLVACNGETAGALETTGSVAGWVCLGPFGSASAGARVSAFSDAHLVTGEAGADGSFILEGVAVGTAQVVMTNRVQQQLQRVTVEENRTAEIGSPCAVTSGAIAVNLCIDGSVDPEVGTAVRLDYIDFGGPAVATVHDATDALGEATFSGLVPGTYRVTIASFDEPAVVDVEPGMSTSFDDPGCYDPSTVGSITGRICNPIDGEPVESVPVELKVSGEETRDTTTDASGRFRFDAVAPGDHTLTIKPPLQESTDVQVDVNAGETTVLPDACGADDAGSVAGTVCDATDAGSPAPDVNVRLDVNGEPARFAVTSASGYFRIETVPAGTHQLTIPLPAAAPRTSSIMVAVNEEAWFDDTDCNAAALGSVSGRVCNPADGAPVPDIPVDLEVTGESVPRTTETDSNGEFLFESVPPGTHEVVVRPPLQQEVREPDVVVTAGNETVLDSPQCDSGPPPDPATLTGIACIGIDSFHQLAGATVAVDFNPGIRATIAGTDGAYTLSGLNAGDADVTISRGAFTTTFAVTLVADQTLDLGMTHCLGPGVSIAVVTGPYDDVGAAYADLGLTPIVDTIDGSTDSWVTGFMSSPVNLQDYDVVVINSVPKMDLILDTESVWVDEPAPGHWEPCGFPPSNTPECATLPGTIALDSLDDYLQGGGAVYVSDWAYDIVRRQFQYYIDFYSHDFYQTRALCGHAPLRPNAMVLDENLAIVLGGASVPIEFEDDFEFWAAVDSYSSQPNTYLVPFLVADITVYDFPQPTPATSPECGNGVCETGESYVCGDCHCDPGLPVPLQGSPLLVATTIPTGGRRLVFSAFRYPVTGGRNKDVIQQVLLEL